MRTPCCHTFLAFILKLLNFLQCFIGLSIILYSAYMLNEWNKHSSLPSLSSPYDPRSVSSDSNHVNIAAMAVSVFNGGTLALPAPWVIYAFMGVGILLCCITCIGHIAAEAINGCCLCFYTLLMALLILLEAALVAFIALDRQWEKDLPSDPTGELDHFREFIQENVVTFKWVGIIVLIIQALSVLIALMLQAMVSAQREDHDSEGDYNSVRGKAREPLINPQLSQTSGSMKGDGKGAHSDIWSSRMRGKYRLNNGGFKNQSV